MVLYKEKLQRKRSGQHSEVVNIEMRSTFEQISINRTTYHNNYNMNLVLPLWSVPEIWTAQVNGTIGLEL